MLRVLEIEAKNFQQQKAYDFIERLALLRWSGLSLPYLSGMPVSCARATLGALCIKLPQQPFEVSISIIISVEETAA